MRAALGLGAGLALVACEDLGAFEPNVCGNRILELSAGEDCDSFGAGNAECGNPGTSSACKLVCEPGGESLCPEGWSCGLDRVCRARSKRFADVTVLPLDGGDLAVADFDGDARDDLVIFGQQSVSFGFADAEGRFSDSTLVEIADPTAAPLTVDIDADGLDDVLYPTEAGVLLFPGSLTRSPVPAAVPFETVTATTGGAHLVAVRALAPSEDVLVLGFFERAGAHHMDVVGYEATVTAPEVQAFLSGGRLGPRVGVADIDGGASDDELAIAQDGGDAVLVVTADCFLQPFPGGCRLVPRATVGLPPGRQVSAQGARFGDVDGDGATDLLVDTVDASGADRALVVALGDGGGGFASARVDLQRTRAILRAGRTADSGRLIDLADVDGDGDMDYLTSRGLHVHTASGAYTLISSPTPWSEGRLVDFNRDGWLDAVGIRPDGAEVVLATGDGAYNTLDLPVGAAPSDLVVGDFDGDLELDVAVVEGAGQLALFFRKETWARWQRVLTSQLPPVAAIVGGRLPGRESDGIDDLLVAVRAEEGDAEVGLVRFDGTSTRRLVAPLLVSPRPQVIAAGRFEPGATGPQLLIGSRVPEGMDTAWRFSVVDGPGLSAFEVSEVRSLDSDCAVDGERGLLLTAATPPGEGRSQLFGIIARPVPMMGQLSPKVVSFQFEDGKIDCDLSGPVDALAATRLEIDDLDGDGHFDAIVGFETQRAGAQVPEAPPVVIWWGTAGGGFSGADAYDELLGEVLRPVFVPSELDGDETTELVFVGTENIYFADPTRGELAARVVTALERQRARVESVVRLDVNGDGLEDIVFSTGEEVLAIPQQPCTADLVLAGQCTRTEPK